MRGKKKPSATILARELVMGFLRFFSTSMREENVRIFRALGPERVSAAERARGCIIFFSSEEVMAEVRVVESVHAFSNFGGSLREGKAFLGTAVEFVREASSAPKPASSRAPRPRVVSIEARWLRE